MSTVGTKTKASGKYGTPAARWAGVGPYYAMFPSAFADEVIEEYTKCGNLVCDPFAGRGTAIFSAATRGRQAVGVEINPVGWIYARAKLASVPLKKVLCRLPQIHDLAVGYAAEAAGMSEFFHLAFSPTVLAFLLAARAHLSWRHSAIDATVMALLLVDLHGKKEAALSNQMRQTKSMWPDYAVNWWKEHDLITPPERDPVEFLTKKARWRYAKGVPRIMLGSQVLLGDNTRRLAPLLGVQTKQIQLLFTSPPYIGVTNYHNDQWLRLWLLGHPPKPVSGSGKRNCGRFCNRDEYRRMLKTVFRRAAHYMAPRGVVYVRTDHREHTLAVTTEVLRDVFQGWVVKEVCRPVSAATQTNLFDSTAASGGEVDLILTRRNRTPRQTTLYGGEVTVPVLCQRQLAAA